MHSVNALAYSDSNVRIITPTHECTGHASPAVQRYLGTRVDGPQEADALEKTVSELKRRMDLIEPSKVDGQFKDLRNQTKELRTRATKLEVGFLLSGDENALEKRVERIEDKVEQLEKTVLEVKRKMDLIAPRIRGIEGL